MAKQTVTLYITQSIQDYNFGKVSVNDFNMAQCFGGKPAESILIATVEQEFEIPDIDLNKAQVEGLEAAIQKERADSQVRVNHLLDRISKLKAITHEVSE